MLDLIPSQILRGITLDGGKGSHGGNQFRFKGIGSRPKSSTIVAQVEQAFNLASCEQVNICLVSRRCCGQHQLGPGSGLAGTGGRTGGMQMAPG